MFKIKCGDYTAMIEAFENLESMLEEEQETMKTLIDASDVMSSEAITMWQTGFKQQIDTGYLEETRKQSEDIRTSMEAMRPLVNRLAAEGKLLGEQLESDAYLYPYASEAAAEELIMLDEAYVGQILGYSEQIQETGRAMKGLMEEVFALCSGIVDLGAEKTQLEKACKSIDRIGNFQTAFKKYVVDVQDLDESLLLDFQMLADKVEIMQGIAIEDQLQKKAAALQIQKMEELLGKNPLYWTEAEAVYAADAWENAVEEGDIETMEKLLHACENDKGGLSYEKLGILREGTEGKRREILTELMFKQLPELDYAECLVDISKEGDELTVIITQDVLLEEDNTITLTAKGVGENCKVRAVVARPNNYNSYSQEYYETALGYLQKDAEGNYVFESVLRQDAAQISEQEKEILSLLYQDKCRMVEIASGREGREEQFEVTERFVEGMFRHMSKPADRQGVYTCLYLDEEWQAAMGTYIKKNDSFAFQMLLELGAYEKEEGAGWYEIPEESPVVDITIEPYKAGLVLAMDFMQTDLRYKPKTQYLYATSTERALQYISGFDMDVMEHLNALGYGKKDIVVMFGLAESTKDMDFMEEIMKEDYETAFVSNPNDLSINAGCFLTNYMLNYTQFTDEQGNCTELEHILNEMLSHNERAEQYLEYMAVSSEVYKKGMIYQLVLSEEQFRNQMSDGEWKPFWEYSDNRFVDMEEQLRITASFNILLKGLYINYIDDEFMNLEDEDGTICQFRLDGLKLDEREDFTTDIGLYNVKDGSVEKSKDIRTMMIWNPDVAARKEVMNQIAQLDKKAEEQWLKSGIDTTLSILGIAFPKSMGAAQAAVDIIWGAYIENPSEILKNLTNEEMLGQYMSEQGKGASKAGASLLSFLEKQVEISGEKDAHIKQLMMQWFYSGEMYVSGGEEVYLGEDICNYRVLKGIQSWNQQGCAAFMKEKFPTTYSDDEINQEIDDWVNKNINLTQEEAEVIHFLIYGNSTGEEQSYHSILEIENDTFVNAIEKMGVVMQGEMNLDNDMQAIWLAYLTEGQQ